MFHYCYWSFWHLLILILDLIDKLELWPWTEQPRYSSLFSFEQQIWYELFDCWWWVVFVFSTELWAYELWDPILSSVQWCAGWILNTITCWLLLLIVYWHWCWSPAWSHGAQVPPLTSADHGTVSLQCQGHATSSSSLTTLYGKQNNINDVSHQMRFYWDARKFLSRVQNMEIPELFKFDFNWVSLHDQDINTVIIHFPITPCSADAVVVSNLHSCMNAVPEIKVQFYHGESKLWFLILWCKLQVAGEVMKWTVIAAGVSVCKDCVQGVWGTEGRLFWLYIRLS